ncbi:hypothetical protein PMSD_23185 [Paenibacillus macquariensis subsp. defensor]|nr:hypothetical protein PMSD_23185 [Paenibacillus macquariensis subsp. defensor]
MFELSSMGKRIKQLREKRGFTQSVMAERLDMNPANFSSYERDKSIPPSDKLAQIADILKTSTDYLLCRVDNYDYNITEIQDRNFFVKEEMASYSSSPQRTPLVGTICAGDGLIADDNIEEYISFPLPTKRQPDFALRVKGDSMRGADIFDGDIVYLRKESWAEYNGQIVAVIINGAEGSLKRMKWTEGSPLIKLIPENPEYEIKEVRPSEIVICGVYCGHFRPETNYIQ